MSWQDRVDLSGQSPSNIYVPAEFIGQATIVDSNASAKYGQFHGGVVELRSHSSAHRPLSRLGQRQSRHQRFRPLHLATPDGTNPQGLRAPSYVKDTLAVICWGTDHIRLRIHCAGEPQGSRIQQAERLSRPAAATRRNIPTTSSVALPRRREPTSANSRSIPPGPTTPSIGNGRAARTCSIDVERRATSTQLKYETDLVGVRSRRDRPRAGLS